jgi:hypothetical protein
MRSVNFLVRDGGRYDQKKSDRHLFRCEALHHLQQKKAQWSHMRWQISRGSAYVWSSQMSVQHCCSMRERMLAFDANSLGDQKLPGSSQALGVLKLDRYCRTDLRKDALLDRVTKDMRPTTLKRHQLRECTREFRHLCTKSLTVTT